MSPAGGVMFKTCEHDDAQNRSGWIRDFEVNRAKCLIKESCTVCGHYRWSAFATTLRSDPHLFCAAFTVPCYVVIMDPI